MVIYLNPQEVEAAITKWKKFMNKLNSDVTREIYIYKCLIIYKDFFYLIFIFVN